MIIWVNVTEYCRRTGHSRKYVLKQIEEGSIIAVKEYEGGFYKVKYETHEDILESVLEKLDKMEEKLDKLSQHFGASNNPRFEKFYYRPRLR